MFLMAFGLFGYAMRKLRFDVTPLVMGFILTPPLEYAYGQTVLLSQGDVLGFVLAERPVTVVLLTVIPIILGFFWWRGSRRKNSLPITQG